MLTREKITPHCVSIPTEELSFHPHSFADDAGRLFWWNGQLRRGINSEHAPFFERLFRDGVIQSLVERGLLIESELTGQAVDGYAMVVRHRVIPFISYPNEWCAAMLKEAALTIIDLALELAPRGLTLKDAHPWNLLFDASNPVFADLTSIAPQKDESSWPAYDEFCRFCYYPLILMSHGQERLARSLLPEYEGVLRKELLTVMRGSAPSAFVLSKLLGRGLRSIQSLFENGSGGRHPVLTFLKRVRRDVEKIQLPRYESKQRELSDERISPSRFDWTPQQQALGRILDELEPGTVLDLSRGATWTSILSALAGRSVVSITTDPSRATAIYETARDKGLPILPLIIDFIKPTPSVGYPNHYSIAATERLKCDMVIALGLADRIAVENHFSFELIAEGLSSFSKRWLIADFARCEGEAANERLDGFINALRKRFSRVRILSSDAERSVLLCEK